MAERFTKRLSGRLIQARVPVLTVIFILTTIFFFYALKGNIRIIFSDLMPSAHPYIKVHNEFKSSFGGSNMVSIMLKVKEGDIFRMDILEKIQRMNRELRMVEGVDEYQIISIASKKLREIRSGTYGFESKPLMWPDLPKSDEELQKLRESVLSNRLVYGVFVSRDLKAALTTVDFIERRMDYAKVYHQINEIVGKYRNGDVEISIVGEPILQGLINAYLPQSIKIFIVSIGVLGLILLVVFMRSFRGTLVPLLAACVSAIWALGIASILNINMDPLGIVIAFLITARVISHSVQSVNRFDLAIAEGAESSKAAANTSLCQLFRPGLLSVITDAGGILVVALAPIPLLQKSAYIGAVWVSCISVTGVVLTPVLLSWVRHPHRSIHSIDFNMKISGLLNWVSTAVILRFNKVIVFGAFTVILVCGYFGSRINIGDANPGTPLLWQDSAYNVAVKEINERFLGTDRMFVVLRGDENDTLKRNKILNNMSRFQRYCERQQEIGGTLSLADVIPPINRVIYEGNPHYEEVGRDKLENGELLFWYVANAEPGDLVRFSDLAYTNASISLYFRDHQGKTIRKAVAIMKDYFRNNPMEGAHYELTGGLIGVLAAVNEVIFAGQVESIALALLVVMVTSAITYRCGIAGIYFMIPILLSNTITFSYMAFRGIGLTINTLPVAALGIGLGVDYAIYVVDAIREEFDCCGDVKAAILAGLNSAGRGVIMTATPLVLCTGIWYVFSSLRFQAEMAILIALWMAISALSSLLVMPAMLLFFKPEFVFNKPAAGKLSDSNEVCLYPTLTDP